MGKSDFTSANPNNLASVAGRSTCNESSRVLPKLIIPSDASLLSPKYYDAYDYFYDGPPETPVAPDAWHTPIAAESDCTNNGCLNKSLTGSREGAATPVPLALASPTAKINCGPTRGSSKAVASLTTQEHTPTSPAATSAPRSAKTKALLIGLSYRQSDRPLRHATGDAHRFATTLTKLGYSSENIKVVTDEPGRPFASQEYLLECIDWLVQDVSEGEEIFFVFSGHCDPSGISKPEPYLVAGDLKAISQSTFQDRLVAKVPAGAELTIVLDCCNAAAMVQSKYCIGRMERAETGKPSIPTIHPIPQRGPLQGLSAPSPMRVGPAIARPAGSGPPITLRRNLGGVIGARPFSPAVVPTGSPAAAPYLLPVNLPPSIDRRRGRQLVVEGHPVWQFEERTRNFVSPAGKIIFWAGAGERQKAFEASGDVKNGIVTDAICSVLDTSSCLDNTTTLRDVWRSVVGAVGKENNLRRERDSKKKDCANIPTSKRWQGAQLWVSQDEPLSSSSPILDQSVFWRSTT